MLGAIAGDVVGSAYEFHNTKDYRFEMFPKGASFTDDSVMTLAVAQWLMEDGDCTLQGLEDCLVRFAQENSSPKGDYGGMFRDWLFYPEIIARRFAGQESPYESRTGRRPYGSWGNGSAMRVAPVGWACKTLEETERVAALSASVTHNHPEGVKGAQATAAAIFLARTGKSKEEIRTYVEDTYGYDLHRTWDDLHMAYGWDSSCQGTVPEAIIAFLDSADYEDAVRKAVSMGGDSDTLACITGGIAEAFYMGVPGRIAWRVLDLLPEKYVDLIGAFFRKYCYANLEWSARNGAPAARFLTPLVGWGWQRTLLENMRDGKPAGEGVLAFIPHRCVDSGGSFKEEYYGLDSVFNGWEYLADGKLSALLEGAVHSVLRREGEDILGILGDAGAVERFHSCMTIMDCASPGGVWSEVLERFFGGKKHQRTMSWTVKEREFLAGPSAFVRNGLATDDEERILGEGNIGSAQEERERTAATLADMILIGGDTMEGMVRHYLFNRISVPGDAGALREKVTESVVRLDASLESAVLCMAKGEAAQISVENAIRMNSVNFRNDGPLTAAAYLDSLLESLLGGRRSAKPLLRLLGHSALRKHRKALGAPGHPEFPALKGKPPIPQNNCCYALRWIPSKLR